MRRIKILAYLLMNTSRASRTLCGFFWDTFSSMVQLIYIPPSAPPPLLECITKEKMADEDALAKICCPQV
eukprot:scaffold113916_cov34-Attheya_sp.AAC.1